MGMFERYDNLTSDYIPDNTTTYLDKEFLTIDSQIPRPMYDINNNFIGYSWDKGELFSFEVSVDDMITVRKNSLIFNNHGETPDSYTVAETIGQQAYNTVDAKSWTFIGKVDGLYNWVEDDELLYPVNGDKSIIIHTDMTNKYIELDIFNFRQELVYSQQGELNKSSLIFKVDEELSKILKSGIYNVEVKICTTLTGDVNDDGKVDEADSLLLGEYISKPMSNIEINTEQADIDKDGDVDKKDKLSLDIQLANYKGDKIFIKSRFLFNIN